MVRGRHKAEVEELQKNPPIRQTGNSIRVDYVNINNISVDYEITVRRTQRCVPIPAAAIRP